LLGAKSGEYNLQGNTSSLKSWIRCRVWRAIWGRQLSCCRHSPEHNKTRHFFFRIACSSWFRSISLYTPCGCWRIGCWGRYLG